jgi:S1-C subfamily serine protease
MSRWWILAGIMTLASLPGPPGLRAEENVYRRCVRSTVWIVQPASNNRFRTGSGTLIDVGKRLVLTNHHVVSDPTDVLVFFPSVDPKGKVIQDRDHYMQMLRTRERAIPGKVLFSEPSKDLAIIQLASVPKGVSAIRLAADVPSPGDAVHSIGSPGISAGLFNYTEGRVKAVAWKKYRTGSGPNDPNGFEINARIIETSSATNQGDSGGPLLNDRGELVGVTQGILVGAEGVRPISYFIAVSEVRTLLKERKVVLTPAVTSAATTEKKPSEGPTPMASSPVSKRQREQDAVARLNGAKIFLDSNKRQARELLEDLIERFPDTEAAAEAQKLLDLLQKGKK